MMPNKILHWLLSVISPWSKIPLNVGVQWTLIIFEWLWFWFSCYFKCKKLYILQEITLSTSIPCGPNKTSIIQTHTNSSSAMHGFTIKETGIQPSRFLNGTLFACPAVASASSSCGFWWVRRIDLFPVPEAMNNECTLCHSSQIRFHL